MKLHKPLLYKPFILFSSIYTREIKICVYVRTGTRKFTELLIIIVPSWNKLKFSSTGEPKNYIHAIKLYL